MLRHALPLLLAVLLAPTFAAEVNGSLAVTPEWRDTNVDSAYYVAPPTIAAPRKSSRQDLGLRLREGGFNAQGTLRFLAAEGREPERHGIVNQFYYDGEINPGNGWTLGKKVMSWGVGFGFRPLDVVQREDRRTPSPPPLVGVPLAAWERLTADEAWSLVWTRPGLGHGAMAAEEPALAVHWYRLAGSADLHGVARVSAGRRLEIGAGFSRTVGDEWSLHAGVLNQGRYEKKLSTLAENGGLLAASDPMRVVLRQNALKAVAGTQWTGESGLGVLVEGWYDGEAYNRDEWKRLNALVRRQRALAGVVPPVAIDGNIAWSARAFDRPNLNRDNLLMRISYDVEARWKSALELLVNPSDGGRAVTASIGYDGNRQHIGAGLRLLGGPADSALAQAPYRRLAWIEWRLALP